MQKLNQDFETFILNNKSNKDCELFWDQKSPQFYESTEKINDLFVNEFVFKLIKERALLNDKSQVLDIGCGTGRHLLEFSKYTPHLTGTDISSKMLSYAENKLNHIPEAKLIHGIWTEHFTEKNRFDFVFASMTPAISSIEHLKQMTDISKKYCMMERFVYQKDEIDLNIEKILGKEKTSPHNNKNYVYGIWNILWNLGFFPEVFFDKKIKSVERKIEDYTKDITDENKLKIIEFLELKEKNGKIYTEECIIKAIILWDKTLLIR